MSREQLSYGLGRLAALARQRDWVTGEAAGLTPTQGDTLRLLADRPAGLRLGELAAHLSVRPSTASDVVAVLVAKVLVRRVMMSRSWISTRPRTGLPRRKLPGFSRSQPM